MAGVEDDTLRAIPFGVIGLSGFLYGLGPNYDHYAHDPDIPAQRRASWFEDPTTHIRAQFVQVGF
jgi:hypothetical protein